MFGLKKFLKEFSLLDERHVGEVSLWKDYMIYATLFGIADQVIKDMKKINPEYFNMDQLAAQMANESTLSTIYSTLHSSTSRAVANKAARESAMQKCRCCGFFFIKLLYLCNQIKRKTINDMSDQLITIANSFAEEYCSDAIYPAHLFKAILHKDMGLVHFIESELDKDYYYLQDWADVQMQLAPRAVRPMRDLELSSESNAVMDEAENYKVKFDLDEATPVCILASLVTPGVGFSFDQLKTLPLTPSDISAKMGGGANVEAPYMEGAELTKKAPAAGGKGSLAKYCVDKTAIARAGNLDNVIGFEKEISVIYEILGRKTKANLLITGEAGVGKTSLVNGFVRELAADHVPGFLSGAVAYELDTAALGGDAQYKGEVEDRFKNVITEVENLPNAVLIIESIDKLFDKQGSLFGASSILKNELSKGRLQLLATSSIDGYTKNIETDKEMTSKLEKITVEEPTADLTLRILKGAIPAYEEYHGLKADETVLSDAIRLAKRYLTEKYERPDGQHYCQSAREAGRHQGFCRR